MCEWGGIRWEEKMVRQEKGMADGLVSAKEHEGIGARGQKALWIQRWLKLF